MKFIDRSEESAFLKSKMQGRSAQFIVLWGKRRVGKTELVRRFVQGKPHIYFLSETTSENEQIKRFSAIVGDFFDEPLLKSRGFTSWEEAFIYIGSKRQEIIVVFDEFPYLIQSNPAIPSIFQRGWDESWSRSTVYLILLGSSVGMMESEVLGSRSPLYGRRTGQWKVEPLPFYSASEFRSGKSFEDRMLHFCVAGGMPAYWLQFEKECDFYGNLQRHVLSKGQFLYDEAEFVLREELREPRYYFALLQAIAEGKRKLSEIVNATGLSHSLASKYLGILSDLKIVLREVPVTEKRPLKSKKGLYDISDEFFRFWFRFVFPYRAQIELGKTAELVRTIRREMPQYISYQYEKVARELLVEGQEKVFPILACGRWWDKNDEIDIVAHNTDLNSILFGEVKWSNKQVGTDILLSLKEKAGKVAWGRAKRKEYYCLFSKSGFTDGLLEIAEQEGTVLFEGERCLL